MAFTSAVGGPSELLSVEVFKGDKKPSVVWNEVNVNIRVNEVAGTTKLVTQIPPMENELSSYIKRYLTAYSEIFV